jgi:predicted TIM-barrel fold metal-dependent hydrolase
MRITDFHTHAFADKVYKNAMAKLTEGSGVLPFHDGSLPGLLASMDEAGIDRSVMLSIATKPTQFDVILEWCRAAKREAGERIVPFASVMPQHESAARGVRQIAAEGIKGVKIHPCYQGFVLDAPELDPFYSAVTDTGLILLAHTGYDIAFPAREQNATPVRTANVLKRFPGIRFVAAHYGGWEDWEDVKRYLLGRPVWLETSWFLERRDPEYVRSMLLAHDPDYLLFGTDSPWVGQKEELAGIRALGLPDDLLAKLLDTNAERLLAGG